MIIKRDGLKFQQTPTNLKHIKGYLQSEACSKIISGISLNSHLYTTEKPEEKSQSTPVYEKAKESDIIISDKEDDDICQQELEKLESQLMSDEEEK